MEGGSSMSRIQTDIWSQTCSIGFMSGLRDGQSITSTSCWSKKAAVSRAVWGRALSWTYAKLHPNIPVAHGNIWFLRIWIHWCRFIAPSTTTSLLLPHGGLHPLPWLTGHDFHHQAGRRHESASPIAYGAPGPDRPCSIGRRYSHWRYSVSIVWGPILCASSPTHGGVACAPKWALDIWLDAETNIRWPEAVSEWFELTFTDCVWPFNLVV